ncbi:heparinase II/III family protein [Bacillus sp. FJAT-49705]|uniref:Heparinase II/III family protein n=1 Tax=Cytobacillus citreus TaxID=2833586 RepID=A0ABS5NUU8_9BACI|nr:heparinase II/III family protein [Cytobacillus citreus]MBS4191604.1 heparinase II/III family protein [Cytobacillus citreus]
MNNQKNYSRIKSHPRILFTQQEIEEVGNGPKIDTFLEKADQFLNEDEFQVSYPMIDFQLNVSLPLIQLEPLPEAHGYIDFPYWTMYSRAIEDRMTVLSIAYALTGKGIYGDKVKEYLLALSRFTRWYEFPNRGAEGNLSNAHFTLAMAIGYDSIVHLLNGLEKELIQEAIVEKGLKPLVIDFENYDSHNIIASKRVSMLIGALSVIGERDVDKYLTNAYDYLFSYLEDRLTSPEIEGLLYTGVAIRHVLMAADALYRTTGDNTLISHPYFKSFLPDLFFYMLGSAEKQTFVNFSDSFYILDVSFLMGKLAQRNKHPVTSWYFKRAKTNSQNILLSMDNMVKPMSPNEFYQGENSKVFPTIGWAAFRSGWEGKSHFLAFASSSSAKGHNHYDQNNFVLHVNDEWLITNPGYQDYVEGPRNVFTLGTIGHNSMLVNGKGQEELGKSRIVDWFLSPSYDYCLGDATRAYNGAVKKWERKLLHIDQSYYILLDHVLKNYKEDQLTFLYHTTSMVVEDGKKLEINDTIKGNIVSIIGERASATIYHYYPEKTKKKLEQFLGAEEYGTYMTVEPAATNQDEIGITMIYPHSNKQLMDKKLVFESDVSRGEINLKIDRNKDFLTDYFLFAKEQDSSTITSNQGDLTITGDHAWVCFDNQLECPVKLFLFNGTELNFRSKRYITANKKLNVMVEMKQDSICYDIELRAETIIHISCERSSMIIVNGNRHDRKGKESGQIEIVLPIGRNVIVVIKED